jgi:hypothetical protein
MLIHICVDVEVAIPASSRRRAMGATTAGRITILSPLVIREARIFPWYSWPEHIRRRYSKRRS